MQQRLKQRQSATSAVEQQPRSFNGGPSVRVLSPLATIEPQGLSPVQEVPGWETVELAVDSGASETVIPDGLVKGTPVRPSAASLRGVEYEVANGMRIPNLGEQRLEGFTDGEGLLRSVTAQVCGVNKPLMSVCRLVQAGHRVC